MVLVSGCSNIQMPNVPNPFQQPSVTESYVSQFPDVPIPAPMSTRNDDTLVTVGSDGTKFGVEAFSGRVDRMTLANVMMQNMTRQGWQLRGSSIGVRSMQLYEKAPHFAAVFFRENMMTTYMDVWVVNGVNAEVLTNVPRVHDEVNNAVRSSSAYAAPASDQVKPLSN
jgi:hypothetical protein